MTYYLCADTKEVVEPSVDKGIDPCDDCEPVVVIDPEDREQVEQFTQTFRGLRYDHEVWEDRMQAALREFANPKPDEPTGLGAVVEDRWGHIFVRTGSLAWRNTNEESFCIWAHIDAVKVLSEGVPS